MDTIDISTLTKTLELSGPYGLIALLIFVLTRMGRDSRELEARITDIITEQSKAISSLQAALASISSALEEVRK
ncbi:MAG: hypothetical protein KC766_08785 [Myxococcales bacterium]|nr:hypothetical protein [Myxococcales bacterium]